MFWSELSTESVFAEPHKMKVDGVGAKAIPNEKHENDTFNKTSRSITQR